MQYLAIQIASGLLLAAAIVALTVKGMAIHRSSDGWKSAAGGLIFVMGFIAGGMVVIAGALPPIN